MKYLLAAALLFPGITLAGEPSLPTFTENKIGTPQLSLSAPPELSSPALRFVPLAPTPAQTLPPLRKPKELVSSMPVIEPRTNIDPKMRIAQPDTTIDYALIVKEPALTPASK